MKKKICILLAAVLMATSVSFSVFADQPVDEVTCTTVRDENNQSEQTLLKGIGRDGSVVWTYETKAENQTQVYWYGHSGNLFFLNDQTGLKAFDALTGKLLWNSPDPEYIKGHGIFDGSGNLCMVSTLGPITLLDRSGSVLARFNTDKKYSSLIVKYMTMTDNQLTLKYAAEGFGADIKEFNDYNTMPSLTVNLSRYQSPVKVEIDEQEVAFDVPPFIEQDRTFVPVRAIFESLGATIQWDGTTKTVTAVKDDTTVVLVIGKKEITVNGTVKTLDVAPQIVHDRTLVPARAVSEAFGYQVGWDGTTKIVSVSTTIQPPAPLTIDTTAFSYLGQTYGELSNLLGPVAQVNWYNGPIAALDKSLVWMGFADGSWYKSNTNYYLSTDLLCTSVITTANRLFPQMGSSTDLTAIAKAFGAPVPQTTIDHEDNILASFTYQGKSVVVYMTDQETVDAENLIFIR